MLRRLRNLREASKNVFGLNRRNVELVYANNRREDYPIADDKAYTKEILTQGGVPVPETIAMCRGLFEVDAVLETLRGRGDFVVKPSRGSGGDGILVVERADPEGGWRTPSGRLITPHALRQHIANIGFGAYSKELEDVALIERRVVPHAFFRSLWDRGVCDIRVIMLGRTPLMAMIRVPTSKSDGRANLHQGGLGVAVDLDTGMTVAASTQGRHIARHPETEEALLGLQVPLWGACLEVCDEAAAAVPLGYLGVDLVIDEDAGPMVLELNVRPGLEIQNVCRTALGDTLPSQREVSR